MTALRSTCCDAPVYLRTGPENNHSSSGCICEACGAACTAKLNGHSPIVEAVRDLLIEAAEELETLIEGVMISSCTHDGGRWDNAEEKQEYDRLTDLVRRLRETASA